MIYLVLFVLLLILVAAICWAEARELDNGTYLDVLGEIIEGE